MVGGNFTEYNGSAAPYLVRINTDGTIDGTFTQTGTGLSGLVSAIKVQADNKIIVGGTFTTYNGTTVNRIARLNSDGSLDTDFTTAADSAFTDGQVIDTDIDSQNRIVAVGTFTSFDGVTSNRVVRLLNSGALDTSFVQTGTGLNSTVHAVAIDHADRIVVGGVFATYNGANARWVTRLTATGALDTSFAVPTGFNTGTGVYDIKIQPTNYQILAGGSFLVYRGLPRRYIVRIDHLALPTTPSTPDLVVGSDSGPSDSDDYTNDTTPTFTGSCTGTEEIYLKIDSVETGDYVSCSSSTYTFTPSALSDGTYSISVFASSSDLISSGVSADSSGLFVDINTVPPEPVITSPLNEEMGVISPVTVSGTCLIGDENVLINPGEIVTVCSFGFFTGDVYFETDPTTITVTHSNIYGNSSTTSIIINGTLEEEEPEPEPDPEPEPEPEPEEEDESENEPTENSNNQSTQSRSRSGIVRWLTPPNFALLRAERDGQSVQPAPLNKPTTVNAPIAVTTSNNVRICPFFTKDLVFTMRDQGSQTNQSGNNIVRLQVFLNEHAGAKLPITGYYYTQTRAAVTAFQEKYREQILSPLGFTRGTGFWGPASRAFANKLVGC